MSGLEKACLEIGCDWAGCSAKVLEHLSLVFPTS